MEELSIKERLRRAGPVTRTVPVWVGADLDLLDEYERARAEAEKPPGGSDSLAGDGRAAAQSVVEMLRERLAEYRVDFRVRGLDPRRWQRLVSAHEPRRIDDDKIHPADRNGWNAETFPSALVRASVISPELDEEDWLTLLGDEDTEGILTGPQVDELAAAAFRLSKVPVDVPFLSAASETSLSYEPE